MQQIADWLGQLGLGQYAQRFAENDINFSILSDLTDQDLKEIGVSSLGHRRQLLRAIAELNEVEKGPLKAAPPAATSATPQDAAERRQVTVMFSDLVGSTALAARMDPEDLREIISAYQKCVAETVGRFGGFVAKYLGDGVLIYFGYPHAHEDDAERAVRAGLELIAAVGALKAVSSLQTRVGIATGLVVVGDLIGTGSPLFVEEMTKAVLEAGSEKEAQRTVATVPSTALAVPASLHASLMARLDRLGPPKEVAQIGAAIGREFSHALVAAVTHKAEGELQSALDRLMAAGLLFRQGAPPHATYLFKHALVRDAAYGTLLREPRRALHASIAEALQTQVAEIAQSQPELLAHHFTQAGMTEAAIEWWGRAGQRSMARYALVEGAEQLKRALDQIATLPSTPDLRREEIKLELAFANALTLTGDVLDGKEHYDRAVAIYDPAEHRPLTTRSGRDIGVSLLVSRSGCAWLLGYPAAARSDAERAVKKAREVGHDTTILEALWRAGYHHILCGDYAAANAALDELIGLADERGTPYWKAIGTAVRGWLFALTGKASDAVRAITSGIASLRSTGATLYEPQQLQYLAMAHAERGQLNDAWCCIDDAIDKIEKSK
jgi:tetratricopeptide (TPR) repeat protein